MTATLAAADLDGVIVPLLTPLESDGSVDLDGIGPLVEAVLAGGVAGIVALGTTGEFADLDAAERATVLEATIAATAGRVPVIAGVGAIGTTEACAHARHAAAAGADAVLALPPLYLKLGEEPLLAHFAAIAEAGELPLLLYDFPALSGTALSPQLLARAAAELPRAIGVKQTGGDLGVVHAALATLRGGGFAVVSGSAGLLLPALLAGGTGGILAVANVDPALPVAMHAAFRAGDLDRAVALHRDVLRLSAATSIGAPGTLGLKAVAQAAGMPVRPVVRTPPVDADEVLRRAEEVVVTGWRA